MKPHWAIAALPLISLAACKPPPTDADMGRDAPVDEPTFASEPLPSPDTEGAVWAASAQDRIVYGIPEKPVLLALACVDGETLRIARVSPADEGAGALLALIGNGHIGRFEVDATEVDGRTIWQGEAPANDDRWEPLLGDEEVTVTVPGAGMVTVNPSPIPRPFIELCRFGKDTPPPPPPPVETDLEPPVIPPGDPPPRKAPQEDAIEKPAP